MTKAVIEVANANPGPWVKNDFEERVKRLEKVMKHFWEKMSAILEKSKKKKKCGKNGCKRSSKQKKLSKKKKCGKKKGCKRYRGRSAKKCEPGKRGNKCRRNLQNKGRPNVKSKGRQACNVEALCQKIKDYIKYSNQLRKLKRINKTCSTMEKKRDKAGAGEFSASGEANDASDNSTVQEIADKLKNCTTTAKAKCETKEIPACMNLTLNNRCLTELGDWIAKFGPAKGSCLQANADCCACITGISPAPSADCLNFEALDKSSKEKKKACTGSGAEGSFGHCRKLQLEAAEKGPKAHKNKCDKGKMTTAASSGRRKFIRSNLMKKLIKN
jgi:hypothetical protein